MAEKLTAIQEAILTAAAEDKAVIWPSRRVAEVFRAKKSPDGRVHFLTPSEEAADAFDRGWLDNHGSITPEGRAALAGARHE
jgi:hypothetical protein